MLPLSLGTPRTLASCFLAATGGGVAGVDERGVVDTEEHGGVNALLLALDLVDDTAKSDSKVSCFSDLTSVDLSFFFGLFAVVAVDVACLVSFPVLSST